MMRQEWTAMNNSKQERALKASVDSDSIPLKGHSGANSQGALKGKQVLNKAVSMIYTKSSSNFSQWETINKKLEAPPLKANKERVEGRLEARMLM